MTADAVPHYMSVQMVLHECVCVCVSIKAYVQRFPLDFITLGNVNMKGEIFISIFICEHM